MYTHKKSIVYDKVSELYNNILDKYFKEYHNFSVAKTKNWGSKYNPLNLFLQNYYCDAWYEHEKPADTTTKGDKEESANLPSMPPLVDITFIPSLEGDNEVKGGKGLNLLHQHNKITKKLYHDLMKSL